MKCPACNHQDSRVLDSRPVEDGSSIKRRRECPSCGKSMFKLSGKGQRKPFCVNAECENFLPEDKRGYRKKAADKTVEKPKAAEEEK